MGKGQVPHRGADFSRAENAGEFIWDLVIGFQVHVIFASNQAILLEVARTSICGESVMHVASRDTLLGIARGNRRVDSAL